MRKSGIGPLTFLLCSFFKKCECTSRKIQWAGYECSNSLHCLLCQNLRGSVSICEWLMSVFHIDPLLSEFIYVEREENTNKVSQCIIFLPEKGEKFHIRSDMLYWGINIETHRPHDICIYCLDKSPKQSAFHETLLLGLLEGVSINILDQMIMSLCSLCAAVSKTGLAPCIPPEAIWVLRQPAFITFQWRNMLLKYWNIWDVARINTPLGMGWRMGWEPVWCSG